MMEAMESCVPPGFRFHPTDEELVGYYLRKKVASHKIDLDVIREIDLYRIEPWDLQERCRIGYEEQNEWYFFSHKDKKYPTGTRTNRATMAGFWKATGRDKAVYDKTKLIGMRKTLVFYKGRTPNGQKTDWIMHEYRLESDENGPPQEEGWVVCRAFKKKISGQQTKSTEGWDSSYFFDETNDFISRQPHHLLHHHHHNYNNLLAAQNNNNNNNYMCKQETEVLDNLSSFMNSSDQFIQQLPQLESPNSLPLMTKTTPSSLITSSNNNNNNKNEEVEDHHVHDQSTRNKLVTTDWRALDKFVASQLSQEDSFENPNNNNTDISNNNNNSNSSDMSSLLLLHSTTRDVEEEEEGGNKLVNLSPFLMSTRNSSDCDNIGICVFDK